MSDHSTDLTLVNLHQLEQRDVLIQMGAYAEHRCDVVHAGGHEYRPKSSHVSVRLMPGCAMDLQLAVSRFVNQPTARFPSYGMGF
jgi:hypothetical protein